MDVQPGESNLAGELIRYIEVGRCGYDTSLRIANDMEPDGRSAACVDTDGGNFVGRQHDRPERNCFGCLRPQRHSCEREYSSEFPHNLYKPSRKNILRM